MVSERGRTRLTRGKPGTLVGQCDAVTAIAGEVGDSGPCNKEDERALDEPELMVLPGSDQAGNRSLPHKSTPAELYLCQCTEHGQQARRALSYHPAGKPCYFYPDGNMVG